MSVTVQEFDGYFSHNIQVEDLVSTHELPCHSKIRKWVWLMSHDILDLLCNHVHCCRAKKRKVPLIHGEEIDVDISNLE